MSHTYTRLDNEPYDNPPFPENFFVLIPNTDLAFVMVSKNAVTFLKNVALFNATGEWCHDFRTTHSMIGYTRSSRYLVPVADMPAWEAKHGRRIKFAVYRDPIRRVENSYALFCLDGVYVPYLATLGIYQNRSEDFFRRVVAFETSKPQGWVEPHLRKQTEYYSLTDVDFVIDINDVSAFLTALEIPFVNERSNSSQNKDYRIANREWHDELQGIYANDYLIPRCELSDAILQAKSLTSLDNK